MVQNMHKEIAALQQMTPGELRAKYLEVFGEPTRSGNRSFLFKRLAWRLQSLAEGDLSERARRRAAELARDADIRMTMPRPRRASTGSQSTGPVLTSIGQRLPIPGTMLTRQYRGRLIQVTVLADGFEWEGQAYRSLTAVAKAVTGSHWNGCLFFGLKNANPRLEKP
jgi:hypothetical protein